MSQIRWGIIGLGNIAFEFANAFKYINNAQLKGIASRNEDKLKKFEKQFLIDKKFSFRNYESLIECEDIDVVYIALPNSLHYEWIIKSLKNNKKVLVEKPATINSLEIDDIKKNYLNHNSFFTESFMYMYHPQIKKTLELIKSGEIGKLVSMESMFGKDILTKKFFFGFKKKRRLNSKSRLFDKDLGGGVILDLGCYPVSFSTLIASLTSKIDYENIEITNIKKDIGSTDVELDAYAELNFNSNFRSIIGASFTKNLGKKTKIIGTEGEIILADTWHAEPSIINLVNKDAKKIEFKFEKNIFSYEIDILSQLILDRKKKLDFPVMSIEQTSFNMKILEKWMA